MVGHRFNGYSFTKYPRGRLRGMTIDPRPRNRDVDSRSSARSDPSLTTASANKLAVYSEIANEEGREELLDAYVKRAIEADIL